MVRLYFSVRVGTFSRFRFRLLVAASDSPDLPEEVSTRGRGETNTTLMISRNSSQRSPREEIIPPATTIKKGSTEGEREDSFVFTLVSREKSCALLLGRVIA